MTATQVSPDTAEARIAFLDAYWPDWREDTGTQRYVDIKAAFDAGRASGAAQQPPGLGDIVFVAKGTLYFHDWRGVEMKLVSLRIAPEGKLWASVIDKGDPNNTRHRGFGVYDGETTDFEFDHLELAAPVPSTTRGHQLAEDCICTPDERASCPACIQPSTQQREGGK